MLSEKFKDIKTDEDTQILSREMVKLADLDAVHERWIWEGIKAESYIFANEDIRMLSQADILRLVGKMGATYKRVERYTFVNFNFEEL